MGNHAAGQAMAKAAEQAVLMRRPGQTAFALLDKICDRHRGTDAEFEAEDPENPGQVHPDFDAYTDPHPKAALGMLMVEAFAPGGLAALPNYADMVLLRDADEGDDLAAADIAYDRWHDEVEAPFLSRFEFN